MILEPLRFLYWYPLLVSISMVALVLFELFSYAEEREVAPFEPTHS